jgi:ubiquinone/menaquinone biosynthesis C-methylase UbiE
MEPAWIIAAMVASVIALLFAWRGASRRWQLPCPSLLGRPLESRFYGWLSGTEQTLERMNLQPGQRILEMGPGPGRLLLPAAERIKPDGEAFGIDIQPGMVQRLKDRAAREGIDNLTVILGDATQPLAEQGTFDLVFLVTTLGEIPDRAAALRQSFRALKAGGTLSVTELFGDPHYQSRSSVKRQAEAAGFEFQTVHGHWWFYTATFVKP